MALRNCPECGKEISDQVSTCVHCGYKIKRLNIKKILYVGISIAFLFVIIIGFLVFQNVHLEPNERIALNVCKELQSKLKDRKSLEIYEIYVNNEKAENLTIDYTNQVYIKYAAKNSYGGIQNNTTLCLVTNSKNYFIWEGDSDQGDAYFTIADYEIYGKVFEPDGSWKEIDESKINKKLK